MDFFGITSQALFGQLLVGLINGSFYALLSMGLALIFGLLHIGNFAHGAQYMMGAFLAWLMLTYLGIGYWWALLIVPLVTTLLGAMLEYLFIRRIYKLPHVYGLLLTYGMVLVIEGIFRQIYGTSGYMYAQPAVFSSGWNLGFMYLPAYRAWVIVAAIVVCVTTWFVIERTMLGAYLRAATEKPMLARALGIRVPRLLTLTYGFGVGLAGLAGVMAAPIYQVNALMGSHLMIIAFAVVVIGGVGSIKGAIVAGFGLGVIEGLAKAFYPALSTTIVFIVMALVLLVRPAGLFGSSGSSPQIEQTTMSIVHSEARGRQELILLWAVIALFAIAPAFFYPPFVVKVLCFALLASSVNLLIGYVGLFSFGHAAFFGFASYATAFAAKNFGLGPELSILLGVVGAAILGGVTGIIAIRRQGIYFAMVTLALSQIVYYFVVQSPYAGSEDGIHSVPRGVFLGIIDLANPIALYYFVLAIFVVGMLAMVRMIHSPFGRVLGAIRDNEPRAISLGYDVDRFKLIAFVASATLAGLAGSTKAIAFQLASLADIHWFISGLAILMTIVGGVGTIAGPVVGAVLMITLEEYFTDLGALNFVIQGCIFIACVLLFRRGIVGEILNWLSSARPAVTAGKEADANAAGKAAESSWESPSGRMA